MNTRQFDIDVRVWDARLAKYRAPLVGIPGKWTGLAERVAWLLSDGSAVQLTNVPATRPRRSR